MISLLKCFKSSTKPHYFYKFTQISVNAFPQPLFLLPHMPYDIGIPLQLIILSKVLFLFTKYFSQKCKVHKLWSLLSRDCEVLCHNWNSYFISRLNLINFHLKYLNIKCFILRGKKRVQTCQKVLNLCVFNGWHPEFLLSIEYSV